MNIEKNIIAAAEKAVAAYCKDYLIDYLTECEEVTDAIDKEVAAAVKASGLKEVFTAAFQKLMNDEKFVEKTAKSFIMDNFRRGVF